MAQTLYQNLWAPKEVRTLIIGSLLFTMCFLLELIFIFFAIELESSIWSFLYFEIELFGGVYTPFLTLVHLALWGMMFFSILLIYSIIREYTGGRTSIIEILVIIAIFVFIGILRFDIFFGLLLTGVTILIFGYMYLTLAKTG